MTRAQTTSTTQQNTGGAVVPFAAGKNKIINGDFFINQRGWSSGGSSGDYTFDRWKFLASFNTGSATYSAQTFTPGTAPVTGYEARNFLRCVTTGTTSANSSSYTTVYQLIEDVRTFANQTITISFWAKAASGTPKVAIEISQDFGSGGSPSAAVQTYSGQATLSTAWARYSITVTVPSISGKTVGTTANTSSLAILFWLSAGSSFNARTGSIGLQDNTFDIWGVQAESGSTATPFQTATGTLQGELAACQRYFYRHASGDGKFISMAAAYSATWAQGGISFPATMRTTPTLSTASGTDYYLFYRNSGNDGFNSAGINQGNTTCCSLYNNSDISSTAGHAGWFITNNANATVDFSAEL